MSGFAVVVASRPASPPAVDRIDEQLAIRGPHRRSRESVGPCTLLHSALWTTPESRRERQPQRHASRAFWLTADARIDNQTELRTQLTGRVGHPLDTDADLILASYERWGARCADQLVGDFAFAIWDAERAELLVARDPFGVRPAYYASTADGFVAASTIPAVLSALDTPPAVDEKYVAGFLNDVTPRDRTIWEGIRRLAPGETVTVGRAGTRLRTYWMPDLSPHDLSLTDTAQSVRTLFDEAVRCRMRTPDGVAAQLSGGFDSTTVTATAASLSPDVRAISLIYPEYPAADETAHIRAAADHIGIDVEMIDATKLAFFDPRAWSRDFGEPLYSADAPDTAACLAATAATGRSVLLAGAGGDELLFGSQTATFDLAVQFRLPSAFRWATHDGLSRRAAALGFTRAMAGSVIARNSALSRMRIRQQIRTEQRPWINVEAPPLPRRDRAVARARAERYALYADRSWAEYSLELTNSLAAQAGIELRLPFFDRRLVEFILRTPEDHIRVDGRYRGMHRLAFDDRLPRSLLTRTDKADFSGPYLAKIFSMFTVDDAMAAFEALDGRIDPHAYLRGFERNSSAFADTSGPAGFELWAALSVGTFLVSLET